MQAEPLEKSSQTKPSKHGSVSLHLRWQTPSCLQGWFLGQGLGVMHESPGAQGSSLAALQLAPSPMIGPLVAPCEGFLLSLICCVFGHEPNKGTNKHSSKILVVM
jgi:hypothetical protein